MSINIRYPNITGTTEQERVAQIRSYLHQLVEQLNYVFSTLSGEVAETNQQAETPSTVEVQGGEISYYELRSMIIRDLQQLDTRFEELSKKIYSDLKAAKPVKGRDYFTEEEVSSVAAQAAGKISFILDEEGNLYYEVEE